MAGRRGPVRAGYVVVGVFAVGAAACASVLGIDDRSLDPELADASGTDGATGADAGDANPLVDAPVSGDAQPIGDGPPTADTQPSGDAPAPDDAPAHEAAPPDSGTCTTAPSLL